MTPSYSFDNEDGCRNIPIFKPFIFVDMGQCGTFETSSNIGIQVMVRFWHIKP
jgi:hypothetical protein